ncbi:MAG: phage portal protein [Dehalococcoidia bacterium]
MGVWAKGLRALQKATPTVLSVPVGSGRATQGSGYAAGAKAYASNEIVYAAVNLLANSASEPRIIGLRHTKSRQQTRAQNRVLASHGFPSRMRSAILMASGYTEEIDHPVVRLLNNPNPYMSSGQLWATVSMDLDLAGNAYVLKARGVLGNAMELWRLRPDRVKILAGDMSKGEPFITGFEYKVGNAVVVFPYEDVIHFKTPGGDDYYGMPPLMPIMGRIAIDGYMQGFLRAFFERGGTGPGSILSVKGEMSQEDKDEAKERFRRQFGGSGGWHEMMILDNSDGAVYTQLGLARGLRDALPKELDAVSEARIAMAFGIPGSILGLLIGYESSSYANKRQDWQVFWDLTMTPRLSNMDDVLNLRLVPEFAGIDEVTFDLSDIRALQEDVDKLQERARANVQAGLMSHPEGRMAIGLPPEAVDGVYFLPTSHKPVPVSQLGADESLAPTEPQAQALNGAQIASLLEIVGQVTRKEIAPETARIALKVAFPAMDEKTIEALVGSAEDFEPESAPPAPVASGRTAVALLDAPRYPQVEIDPGARAVHDHAMSLRKTHPSMTWAQIAGRVGAAERTLRKYRTIWGGEN